MVPHSSTLAWKIHGQRSLVGCSPWGRWGSETTERLHFHFSLSCIGEGNCNPLQCSCLENPRDGGAWWAAICGVTQSRTQLKQLSNSSSSREENLVFNSKWEIWLWKNGWWCTVFKNMSTKHYFRKSYYQTTLISLLSLAWVISCLMKSYSTTYLHLGSWEWVSDGEQREWRVLFGIRIQL